MDSPGYGSGTESDFSFAFNYSNLSDRILTVEIVPDSKSDGDGCSFTAVDWARKRKRKRRREEINKENDADVLTHCDDEVLNCTMMDTADVLAYENQDEEAAAMSEESPSSTEMTTDHPEEAAFMDLLNFMYSNTLSTITPTVLLDVLMAADKFEIASCMRHCLAARFKDITKFQEEVLNLPPAGIEAVLSNDDLQASSEDAVYDFVLKWAHTRYPNLEERREILGACLCRLIRFPYMTCRKLKKVITCNDFDPELASKDVMEALFFKAEAPYRQRSLAADKRNALDHLFVERAYKVFSYQLIVTWINRVHSIALGCS